MNKGRGKEEKEEGRGKGGEIGVKKEKKQKRQKPAATCKKTWKGGVDEKRLRWGQRFKQEELSNKN